jgi:hypothetical protein
MCFALIAQFHAAFDEMSLTCGWVINDLKRHNRGELCPKNFLLP